MKHDSNETYEEWLKRVQLHEYGKALQQLANGEDPATIAVKMSNRITEKALNPIFKKLKDDKSG